MMRRKTKKIFVIVKDTAGALWHWRRNHVWRTPSNNKLLNPFEADLLKLIRKIKFRKYYNHFKTKLNQDLKDLKNSKYIWVKADRSRNIYKINPPNHHKILKNKLTYKININDTISQIDDDTLKFANIEDKIGKFNMKDA